MKILELVNEAFGGILGDKLPSHATISDWMQKNGMGAYMEAGKDFSTEDYCEILDESIMVGGQKLMLTLGAEANPPGHPLGHADVEVLRMAIAPSWNGDSVEKEIGKSTAKVGHAPSYIISDNGPNLAKGIRQAGITHHRDIGHSFGLILEDAYKGQEDFEGFMREMNGIRTKYHLTKMAYLLPPKQRAIARFMNLFSLVEWAADMLRILPTLKGDEQEAFAFVKEHQEIIAELETVMRYVRNIEQKCKHEGLSKKTAKLCASVACGLISGEGTNGRTAVVGARIGIYLLDEAAKIEGKEEAHNISSDIIESTFGWYKARKPTNKLCGVTASVLSIPLIGKLADKRGRDAYDFKGKMEAVRLKDVKEWKDFNLLDNWAITRKLTFRKIG
jgi:hypothetical protein